MPMRIIGQACPFDVENSYRETLRAGAFDGFLRTPEAKDLPMKFQHERRVGTWQHLHVAGGWLHNMGVLDDRDVEYAVRHGEIAEQSISYMNLDTYERAKAALANRREEDLTPEEKHALFRGSRLDRQIDAAGEAMSKMDPKRARLLMTLMMTLPTDEAKLALAHVAKNCLKPETIVRAQLAEISLVDSGSFQACTFHWEAI